jgi:hypothetical protein
MISQQHLLFFLFCGLLILPVLLVYFLGDFLSLLRSECLTCLLWSLVGGAALLCLASSTSLLSLLFSSSMVVRLSSSSFISASRLSSTPACI